MNFQNFSLLILLPILFSACQQQEVPKKEIASTASENPHLKPLDWLIGTWIDDNDDATITTTYHWDENKNFIVQEFSASINGEVQISGKQILAWDPIQNAIRSWIFDSEGGFGEGSWSKQHNHWLVEMTQILADGRFASSSNIYTLISPKEYQWEAVNREVDGEILPDIDPVTIIKK